VADAMIKAPTATQGGTLGACRLTSLATSMLYKLAARADGLPGEERVQHRIILATAHSVCNVTDSQVEHAGGAITASFVTLVCVLCEAMTAVGIAHLLCIWQAPAPCPARAASCVTGQSPRVALPGGPHSAPGKIGTAHRWGPGVTPR
jgi:hypothetical protein